MRVANVILNEVYVVEAFGKHGGVSRHVFCYGEGNE